MMQPQGLEALMPQGQPMPQINNPRLAAATDMVSSDAEEQILDPRTLAMLKYKDALQAMQAADQMMAAAQPVPTPPTVAERTKLAAEQGIAGLAQRLSPGIQQQGGRMASAQATPGGLPQLAAPNIAGMAGGGIVGYAPGGNVNAAPTPTKVVPRPVPMGQPSVEAQASMADDIASYIYNYKNMQASMEAATDPQQKAAIAQSIRQMQQTYSPDVVSEAHMKMSGQGMAGGGAVRGFAEGKQVRSLPTAGGRENDYIITTDELGNPIYASDLARAVSSGAVDEPAEGDALRAAYAALQTERPDLGELAQTPRRPRPSAVVPASGYGMGDRTGQGAALAGMGSGIMSLLNDARNSVGRAAGKTIYDMINRPESAPESAPVMGGSAREMQQLMQEGGNGDSEGELRRPEAETKDLPPWRLRTRPLYEAGAGVKPPMSEVDKEAEWDAMLAAEIAKPRGTAGNLGARFGLGNLAERAVQYSVDNPYEAAGNTLLALSGAGVGLKLLGVGATKGFSLLKWLAKNPTVSAALSGLALKYGDSVYDLAAAAASGDENAAAELEKAGQSQVAITPTVAAGTPTVAAGATPATPAPDAVEMLLRQPSPRETGPNATPAQFFRSQFRPEEAAGAGAGMSSDDRWRRIIAGLRGTSAMGLGGYAAGSAEEERMMEQEQIAEQERKQRAKMEERGFDLEERNIELQSEQARVNAENNRYNQVMSAVQNYQGLADAQQQKLGTQVLSATKGLSDQLQNVNITLAMGDLSSDDQEKYENLKNNLEQQIANTVDAVTEQFGPGTDYTPIIEALLQSVMPTGMGAGAPSAGGLTSADEALVNLHLGN